MVKCPGLNPQSFTHTCQSYYQKMRVLSAKTYWAYHMFYINHNELLIKLLNNSVFIVTSGLSYDRTLKS